MKDIVSIGEVLIDLTQDGVSAGGVPKFLANPGGAPANLAVAASKLGADVAFIGKVGADSFGSYLRNVLRENGVDVSGVSTDASAPTTMAVVSVDAAGERSFSFYRDASADVRLTVEELPIELLENTRFLHFGSVSLTTDPARRATLHAASVARKAGALVSYDPNYRASLWSSEELAVREMRAALECADVVKLSDEELPLLTGESDPVSGASRMHDLGVSLVFVTLGARGAFFSLRGRTGTVPGVPCQVADTNGAGDTFFGAVLSKLAGRDTEELTVQELAGITAFANRAASLTTSRHGAIPAMPTLSEMGE